MSYYGSSCGNPDLRVRAADTEDKDSDSSSSMIVQRAVGSTLSSSREALVSSSSSVASAPTEGTPSKLRVQQGRVAVAALFKQRKHSINRAPAGYNSVNSQQQLQLQHSNINNHLNHRKNNTKTTFITVSYLIKVACTVIALVLLFYQYKYGFYFLLISGSSAKTTSTTVSTPKSYVHAPLQQEEEPHVAPNSNGDGDRSRDKNNAQSQGVTKTTTAKATTLALLYPPGLLGGYRNQVLRFIALCVHAKRNDMPQLLLPSLLWSTQLGGIGTHVEWFPVPFDWIFDVDHWNTVAVVATTTTGEQQQQQRLPVLVDRVATDDVAATAEDNCWMEASELEGYEQLRHAPRIIAHNNSNNNGNTTDSPYTHFYAYRWNNTDAKVGDKNTTIVINHLQRAALLQGTLRPLLHVSVPVLTGRLKIHPRKQDFSPLVEACRNPRVYGGGTQAGKLWNDYVRFQKTATADQTISAASKKQRQANGSNATAVSSSGSVVPFETDVWVYRALRPAETWRKLAEECVSQHAGTGKYVALHARVELEIMGHLCGAQMDRNLTRIIEHVYGLIHGQQQLLSHQQQQPMPAMNVSGLFVAVSRSGMEEKATNTYTRYQKYADENLQTLNRLTRGNQNQQDPGNNDQLSMFGYQQQQQQQLVPVFECGERVLRDYYASHPDVPDHGALLQSVINFHLAVSSDAFVGVAGSSYSTDVLTTRYHLGKGAANYRYTKTGIERVENGGLPEPHSNCKKKQ